MTEQEIQIALDYLKAEFGKNLLECEDEMSKKFLSRQYESDKSKILQGINIFDRPENTQYECIGCGA